MKRILLLLPVLALAACATVTRGVHEKLTVTSDPSGAEVRLSTGEHGTTPTTFVKTRRTENFFVTVSKPGYISQTVKVESRSGATGGTAMAGNAVAGGLIGLAVDANTGAFYSLYPNPVSVRLTPLPKAAKSRSTPSPAPKRDRTKKTSPKVETTPKSEPTPPPINAPTPAATPQATAAPTLESSSPATSPTP
jgi:hypothetical protein